MAASLRLFRTAQPPRSNYLVVALLVVYVLQAALAYTWTLGAGGLAVLWVGNGVLAAGLLLLSPAQGLVFALGCAATDLLAASLTGSTPLQAVMIMGLDLTEAIVAATLIRRVCGAALDMTSLVRFRNLAVFAALPATLTIGTLGATTSYLVLHDGPYSALWNTWVIGDFLGMMFGAPATLMLARFKRHDVAGAAGPLERWLLIAAMAAATAGIFLAPNLPLLFLVFPLGLIMVIRVSPPYAALAVVVIALVAAAATITGHGPIASAEIEGVAGRVLLLQLFLAAVLFCSLALSSLLAQRERVQRRMIRALEAARASRRRAEEAAGAKSRFMAVMSHEMRTPLNGIVGYAQLLDQRDDIPDVARRQILTMRDSADVLLALISDVLDYSRAEAGHGEIHTAPFAIGQMLERAADMVRPMLEGRDITVEVKSALASDLVVQGDERRLLQVLLNLLGNAAKFTEQGMISLSARPIEPGLIRIAVRDTGIGIAADKLDFVFQPFSQVDSGATRNFEGAGLGLSITKSLVERMGGRIGVESHEARGSEFWLDLPLPCAEPKRPSRMEDDPSGRAVVAKVLVVDDHPVNREVATLMLASAGLEVEAVEDGASAVAAVRSGDFDLVFMDIHMPGMDGLQACREIRALPAEQARVPVIAMTAAALPEDVERCLAAGMNDHISKPIRLEEMLDKAFRQLTPA